MSIESRPGEQGAPYIETQQRLAAVAASLSAAAVEGARGQWATLGAVPDAVGAAGPIIDPEALVLLTTWLVPREPALGPVMHEWVAKWSDLLSVQRTRNIARAFPVTIDGDLRAVATTAYERGKDFRWAPVINRRGGASAGDEEAALPGGAGHDRLPIGTARLPVERDALLVLRLRMAFGVGARADALAYLMARANAWSTVTEIAHATGYTPSAIRRALDRMAEADIVMMVDDGTTRFRCDASPWATLLGLQATIEPWCYWLQHFSFAAAFIDWAEATARRKLTAYAIMEGMRGLGRTFRPSDDRDVIRKWDHAFRDGSTMAEMETALTQVVDALLRPA